MAMLEVNGLHAGYGRVPVLHGIELGVEEGDLVAVFGPNGAGKSTMAKSLFGLLPCERGTIVFDGRPLNGLATDRLSALGLAYVPQESNTFRGLSVEDNLLVGLAGRRDLERNAALDKAYAMFPVLGERRRQGANTLSGGERQMLALACAVVLEPRFLVIDEPTSGLAPIIVDGLIEKALEIARGGATVLWIVGDDASKILPVVDRRYLMRSGVIAGQWSSSERTSDAELAELYFGTGGEG